MSRQYENRSFLFFSLFQNSIVKANQMEPTNTRRTEARSEPRYIYGPNLTDKLSTAEKRRLNQFGWAG